MNAKERHSNEEATMDSIHPPAVQIPWPNQESDYRLHDMIGTGATAQVYGAYCIPRGEKCAIKRINLERLNTSMDELIKEIQAMANCNHENVVTYYTSFVVREELWLVLKLLEGGSLLDIIKYKMKVSNCRHGVFDEATIATVLREVLKGLEYFHNNGQIHRDIKAGNILVGEDGTIMIGDFGVAAWLANGRDMSRQKVRHTFVGTPCWMAPEVMENAFYTNKSKEVEESTSTAGHTSQEKSDGVEENGYDFKADIWSVGITAIEMATGTAPYHKHPPMKVLMLTLQKDPPNLDTGAEERDQYKVYGKTFRKMITDCLQKDPTKRPSASELLKHPFFKKAKDKKYLAQTVVATGLSYASRVHRASKRHCGGAGCHRSNSGEWKWNADDNNDSDDECNEGKPLNTLLNAPDSDQEENSGHPEPSVVQVPSQVLAGSDISDQVAGQSTNASVTEAADVQGLEQFISQKVQMPLIPSVTQSQPIPTPIVQSIAQQMPMKQSVPQQKPTVQSVPQQIPIAQSVPQQIPTVQPVPQQKPLVQLVPQQIPMMPSVPQQMPTVKTIPQQIPLAQSVPQQMPMVKTIPQQIPLAQSVPQQMPMAQLVPQQAQVPMIQTLPQNVHISTGQAITQQAQTMLQSVPQTIPTALTVLQWVPMVQSVTQHVQVPQLQSLSPVHVQAPVQMAVPTASPSVSQHMHFSQPQVQNRQKKQMALPVEGSSVQPSPLDQRIREMQSQAAGSLQRSSESQMDAVPSRFQAPRSTNNVQTIPLCQPVILELILRLRDSRGDLNDIRFEYDTSRDTAEGIAEEMVVAGLVNPLDCVPIATSLNKLLGIAHSPNEASRMVTFILNSPGPNAEYDLRGLVGYGQISGTIK